MVAGCCGKKLDAYAVRSLSDVPFNLKDPNCFRAMLITKGEIDPLYIPGAKCGDVNGLNSQVFICDTCVRKLGFIW